MNVHLMEQIHYSVYKCINVYKGNTVPFFTVNLSQFVSCLFKTALSVCFCVVSFFVGPELSVAECLGCVPEYLIQRQEREWQVR